MRITGGEYRGRVVEAPKGADTRPTSSVVREALFSILGTRILGARVLDLFCGSGIVALEALSRGSASAILVDRDGAALAVAEKNVQALGMQQNCRLWRMDYQRGIRFARKRGMFFDVAFFDPPYQSGYYEDALVEAFAGVMAANGIVVCEHVTKLSIPMQGRGWQIVDTRTYGTRSLAFVRRDHDDGNLSGDI